MDITFTYDHKKCDNIAQILLEKVTKENTGKQLVLHFFSDNGMLLYKHLTRKLNNHPDGYNIVEDKSLTSLELLFVHFNLIHSRLKLVGCVIDSAPTPLTIWPYITSKNFSLFYRDTPLVFPWIKLPFVFGYFLRTELKLPITNCIIATITITPRSIYNYLKFGRNDWGGLYLKNIENENWPIMFFYSYKDNLATYKYIAHIIDVKKNQNPSRLIMAKKFHDSGHVTHLRKYPEEYMTELESFLLQCKNEINKP